MSDEILLHQLLKNPIVEMLTSITNDYSRRTKTSKDSVSQKLDHNFVVIGHEKIFPNFSSAKHFLPNGYFFFKWYL
jgi:hypothetical protein